MVCPKCKTFSEGKFCPECGTPTIEPVRLKCACCGHDFEMKGIIPKFCPECGDEVGIDDLIV